jgi:hypothetical protein
MGWHRCQAGDVREFKTGNVTLVLPSKVSLHDACRTSLTRKPRQKRHYFARSR